MIQKTALYGTTLLLCAAASLAAVTPASADDTCTPPASTQPGVHVPTGADAGTFTYQCTGAYAGEWTNTYYIYNPATQTRTARYDPNYAYGCATGQWTMDQWDYVPARGAYTLDRVVPATAPNLPTGCPAPTSAAGSASVPGSTAAAAPNASISGTGAGSTNSVGTTGTLNGSTTNTNTLGMGNTITSQATSGNAGVYYNTTAGGATTGDAQSIANVANLLQSSSNAFDGATVFTADINGDVNGDILLDPSAILNTGAGSTNTADNNLQVNTNNANDTTAQINNDITVGATSGNATVTGNTKAGGATSGNATAVVNLMNLINSTVAAGQSFIGTININGNLNGDILLPQNVLDQLLASTGPNSTNTAATTIADNSTTTNNTTEGVTNNIVSSATSGNASVTGNTKAGGATSGNAMTNVTLLNLTGSNTIGKDDLLVFVNVLGKWVGMIMNAPAGTTAAELGGGITSTGPDSTNSTGTNIADNSTTTNNANLGITNNVNVAAHSGNATVADNTVAGSARSGNANTAVNILNLQGSNLSLSNWFGILFINVFGMWDGSFGVNTSAGDPVTPVDPATQNPVQAATHQRMVNAVRQFATFVPQSTTGSTASQASDTNASVLGSSTTVAKKVTAVHPLPTPDTATHPSYTLPAIGIGIAALMLIGERIATARKSHQA
jgi:hypothetical protein